VIAGAALGTATSAIFFFYQEHRYNKRRDRERRNFMMTPSVWGKDVSVSAQWSY
jgi:hypothetical protein